MGAFYGAHTPTHTNDGDNRVEKMMMAGALSGSIMAFVNCPVELLKVKLQVQGNATGAAATAVSE